MGLRQWLADLVAPVWHPKIRQRQYLHKQRLYGDLHGEPEPEQEIDIEDMPDER